MKKTLLSILPSLISICSYSQCINEVLPFKTGKTNFNTEEVMNAFNIVREESMYHPYQTAEEIMQKWTESQWKSYQSWTEEMKQQYIVNLKKSTAYRLSPLPEHEKWVKPAYLKNDSIYNISRFFKWDKIPCLQGKNINLVLHFADDTLYRIVVILHYTSKEFTTVKEDYNKLVKELEGKYFKEPFTSRDEVKKKQVGEGYFFRPYKGNKNKIEQYMINYGTSYDYKSEIREYDLIIEYVNTKHTKFSKGESE